MYVVIKVVRSGDLISYCAEEGVRILGEGKFLVSDSFPGNERTKYCLTSKVHYNLLPKFLSSHQKLAKKIYGFSFWMFKLVDMSRFKDYASSQFCVCKGILSFINIWTCTDFMVCWHCFIMYSCMNKDGLFVHVRSVSTVEVWV